jgi:5-methylthioadenosine/S-adenosylhomocysteine deaminase
LRQQHRIGAIAPGLQADLVLLRDHHLNLWPIHDPVSTVVMQAGLANVDSVMIAGAWRKRDGRLLYGGLEGLRAELMCSGQRILSSLGWRATGAEEART